MEAIDADRAKLPPIFSRCRAHADGIIHTVFITDTEIALNAKVAFTRVRRVCTILQRFPILQIFSREYHTEEVDSLQRILRGWCGGARGAGR